MILPLIKTLLAPLLALVRINDGGWKRIDGVNVLLWALPPLSIFIVSQNWYLAAAGLLLSLQWAQGYEDWNNVRLMLVRNWPTAGFILVVAFLGAGGLVSVDLFDLGVGLLAVVLSNVCQPWLRAKTAHLGHWSNRLAEGLEGVGLSVLILTL